MVAALLAVPLAGITQMAPAAADGPFAEYPVPNARNLFDITQGPDGNQWFAEVATSNIGRVTPAGVVTRFALPPDLRFPFFVTPGHDGAVWFIGRNARVGRIAANGAITSFSSPRVPLQIGTGPPADGRVWYSEFGDRLAAMAPDGTVTEYAVPGGTSPQAVTAGPDGGIWFTTSSNRVGRMDTDGTDVVLYTVPSPMGSSRIAPGADGRLWFGEPASNKVGAITTSGTITEYALLTEGGNMQDITAGPDGGLWFTLGSANKIGRISTDGAVAEILVPTPNSGPTGISGGPGGTIWFTEQHAAKVGAFTIPAAAPLVGSILPSFSDPIGGASVKISGLNLGGATGVSFGSTPATSFTVDNESQITAVTPPGAEGLRVEVTVTTPAGTSEPTPGSAFLFTTFVEHQTNSFVQGLTSGPDGNVWFAGSNVGKVTPDGIVTEFPPQWPSSDIAPGSDGNVWFTERNGSKVGRAQPDGTMAEFPLPDIFANLVGIADGPDGNVWVTETAADKIAKVTPTGDITEYPLTPGSDPGGITRGPDGGVWFTMGGRGKIGRTSTDGAVTEFDLPVANIDPRGMTAGPDGNVWYAMRGAARVGRITPSGDVTEIPLPDRGLPRDSDYTLDVAGGPDGAVWYTRTQANVVGRISPEGVVGEFVVPTASSFPHSITSGPGDGRIWFTLEGTSRIGSLRAGSLLPSPPEVKRVSPPSAPTTGGTGVTITGVNLHDATAVSFGGTPAVSFSTVPGNASQLTAVAPPHAIGPVELTVTTPRGTATTTFVYSAESCGQVITKSTSLKADIGPCFGSGVIIGADNVTLDLKGRRIFGFPGPSDGTSAGVTLFDRTGVTVRNGTVSGFDAGILVDGGGRHSFHGLQVRDNVGPDDPFTAELGDGIILFNSANNSITGNTIVNNGIYDGIGVLGPLSTGNTLRNNTIEDTRGSSDGGPAGQGIVINASLDVSVGGALIAGNNVMNNVVRRSGSAGISNVNTTNASISGNTVEDNGLTNTSGNGIGLTFGNQPLTENAQMVVKGNVIRRNGEHGIQVRTNGNRIFENVVTDNSAKAPNFEDLFDGHADCGTNVWKANTWGSAGFDPPCTTTAGTGPAPVASTLTADAAQRVAGNQSQPPAPPGRRARR